MTIHNGEVPRAMPRKFLDHIAELVDKRLAFEADGAGHVVAAAAFLLRLVTVVESGGHKPADARRNAA